MTSPYEEGNPASPLCIIGEAPAKVEMKFQQPFVGQSGVLLNDLLKEAGIARQSTYILNVFERPIVKSKDEKTWFDEERGEAVFLQGKGLTPWGQELSAGCLERLRASGANCFVPLGSAALNLLYGDTRISKWRGSILAAGRVGGRKLVGSYHPMFIIRGNYKHRYTVINDLKRAREESAEPSIRLPERELLINPTYPEAMDFLGMVGRQGYIATDIECLNNHVSCFSVADSPQLAMSIPLLDERGGHRWTEEQEAAIWVRYAQLMGNTNLMKINQNIIFDICFLFQQNNVYTRGPIGCTMCAHHILYPDFPKGLDFICSTCTREPYYKDDGKLWSKPWVDMERFWLYNAKDSVVALEAWFLLEEEMARTGYKWTYDQTISLFEPLLFMMSHGIHLNTTRLAEQREEAKVLLSEKVALLAGISEWEFNPGSPKQCQKYFYVTKGIKPYISTKTGAITTDDKAMARIYKRYNLPEAKLVQEVRALNKLISNYLDVRYDPDQRIRCSYNPRGTTSGRLSSSETIMGTGLNFQNLDTDFKDFLEADPMEPPDLNDSISDAQLEVL